MTYAPAWGLSATLWPELWHGVSDMHTAHRAYPLVWLNPVHELRAATTDVVRGLRSSAADTLVDCAFALAESSAPLAAAIDAAIRPRRTRRFQMSLRAAGEAPWRALRSIWFARIAREALRLLLWTGCENAILRRVMIDDRSRSLRRPAVFAICHSPWGRVLARWVAREGDVALFAAGRWHRRAPGAHLSNCLAGMRQLIRQLRSGGRVAVTIDHFGAEPPLALRACLLGRPVHVSLGAARIAAFAGVPLVPVGFRYVRGRLILAVGSQTVVTEANVRTATAQALAAFEQEIRTDPGCWADAHRFLSAS